MLRGMKERVFKSKKDAMRCLKWYRSRGYKASYHLDTADEWTDHKQDQHCINIFSKKGWEE